MNEVNKKGTRVIKENIKVAGMLFLMYNALLLNYIFVISKVFSYDGYSVEFFSFYKFVFSFSLSVFMIILSVFFKNDFYKIVYGISITIYYFGQSIYYIYNDSPFILVVYMAIPLIMIFLADKLDNNIFIGRRIVDFNDNVTRYFFLILILILILPFFKYYETVNFKNLFLMDIYETRLMIKEYDRGILGYIFSPLSRVVFPFLLVLGIVSRRKYLVISSFIGAISLYLLNGAVKSVFFGILVSLFFIKGNLIEKEKRFLRFFLLGNIIALFSFITLDSAFINDYIRRIIFVPANLYNIYFNHFYKNYTFFSHSKLYSIMGISERDVPIGIYIGENIIGKDGLNANTGIFVEGFLSFGLIGVLFSSVIFTLFIILLKKLNTQESYFGIYFTYMYIINTSFIEPLLVSHGLLFLLFFAFVFFPKNVQINKT